MTATPNTAALEALLMKVEAGTIDGMTPHCDLPAMHVLGAYVGSLDAAKALHEAVLPGWIGNFGTDGFAKVAKGGRVQTVMEVARVDDNPARAWLIAILRALIAPPPKPQETP